MRPARVNSFGVEDEDDEAERMAVFDLRGEAPIGGDATATAPRRPVRGATVREKGKTGGGNERGGAGERRGGLLFLSRGAETRGASDGMAPVPSLAPQWRRTMTHLQEAPCLFFLFLIFCFF